LSRTSAAQSGRGRQRNRSRQARRRPLTAKLRSHLRRIQCRPTHLAEWDPWITLLSAAVVAPIGEEIFFRGFATNAWARSLRRDSALIRAAIFFADIHIVDVAGFDDLSIFVRAAILAFAVRIPVAWALSWIYTRRHSIFASATLHAAYNGSLILLVWWVGTNYTSS
jgi:Predicted metal-dependent membrane protease